MLYWFYKTKFKRLYKHLCLCVGIGTLQSDSQSKKGDEEIDR